MKVKNEFKYFLVEELLILFCFVQMESISVCYSFNAWNVRMKFISEMGSNRQVYIALLLLAYLNSTPS